MESQNGSIYPFSKANSLLGDSHISQYISKYLSSVKAKTVLLEKDYIDKDYIIDYSYFYSRSFQDIDRKTERIHFFSEDFSQKEFIKLLENTDETLSESSKRICSSYLGFTVIKPIHDKKKNSLIGRTLLKTYPSLDGEDERHFVNDTHKLSIYGIPFSIESLPFQTQDPAVGACASTACWICQHPLSQMFGIEKNSLYEVTSKSVTFPNAQSDRNFPSEGLSLIQIKNYFNTIGLESESIKFDPNPDLTSDMVSVAVRAYLNMNLPIIAALELQKNSDKKDYHAVVISGYRYSQGKITELYIHDDQIGPYSKVTPKNEFFTSWENEWTNKRNYNKISLRSLIIPIYPKVRMKFGKIYSSYLEAKTLLPEFSQQFGNQVEPEILLYTLNKYKTEIWNNKFENKKEILMKPFPKYMWIIRYRDNKHPYLDIIYDATMVNPSEEFSTIKYIRE